MWSSNHSRKKAPEEVREFARIVESEDLQGLHFQHVSLCERRAWFHLNRIDYAHMDQRMANGIVAHQINKPRDRSVDGLMGLFPDRIDWANRVVIEAKARSGAQVAVSRQTALYALLLWAATGQPWRAQTSILEERRIRSVKINDALVQEMLQLAKRLSELCRQSDPPSAKRIKLCAACSYRFLCGYS